jgi:hypothetical protein
MYEYGKYFFAILMPSKVGYTEAEKNCRQNLENAVETVERKRHF